MKIGLLFPDKLPTHYLRGDKPLYSWLKKEIDPNLDINNKKEFISYIADLIKTKLKIDIMAETKGFIKIPEFYKGIGHGMTHGMVSPRSWQNYILPDLAKPLEGKSYD